MPCLKALGYLSPGLPQRGNSNQGSWSIDSRLVILSDPSHPEGDMATAPGPRTVPLGAYPLSVRANSQPTEDRLESVAELRG